MRALVALDIDGTLIDTTPSFTRIVKELSGASDAEIWRFRDTGGFNDDWDLSRACLAWIGAGRPEIFDRVKSLADLLRLCDHDPGDMSERGIALYRGGYWRDEKLLVDSGLLHRLAARHRVAACTGRDLWELEKAEELLGFKFPARTTMEDVKKPDPQALLRLAHADDDVILLLGDTAADRLCAERARALGHPVHFFQVTAQTPAAPFLGELAVATDLAPLLQRCL